MTNTRTDSFVELGYDGAEQNQMVEQEERTV